MNETDSSPTLIARKMFRAELTQFPYIFDLWKLDERYFVVKYGLAKYTMIGSETELEAALDLQGIIESTIKGDGGPLSPVGASKNVGLLDAKNPIWSQIRKDPVCKKQKMFNLPRKKSYD